MKLVTYELAHWKTVLEYVLFIATLSFFYLNMSRCNPNEGVVTQEYKRATVNVMVVGLQQTKTKRKFMSTEN